MANEQNLRPGEYKLTLEEQKKGGIASGEARRKKKELREILDLLLDKEYTDRKTGKTASGREAIATALIGQAMKGNVKAFESIRDTIGEKPVERIMYSEVEQSVIDEVEQTVMGNDETTSG